MRAGCEAVRGAEELMNDLLKKNISWNLLGGSGSDDVPDGYELELCDAYIDSDTRVLNLAFQSNFVVPPQDDRKLKAAVNAAMPGFKGIHLGFRYDVSNMAASEDEISSMFIRRMIATASDPHIRGAIDPDKIDIDDGVISIKMVGKTMAETLNGKLSPFLSAKLKSSFNIEKKIVFSPDVEGKHQVVKKMAEIAEEEAKKACEPDSASKRDRAKPSSAQPASGSSRNSAGSGEFGGNPWAGKRRSSVNIPTQGDVLIGKAIRADQVRPLSELTPDMGRVTVRGTIFHKESKPIKNDKVIVTFLITDKKNSTCLRVFLKNDQFETLDGRVGEGDCVLAQIGRAHV